MPDPSPPFSDLLREWNNFYFMAGGAAATLIGLIFVAVSLGANLVSDETQGDIDTFVTPILLYFISVLVLACVMLVPTRSALVVGAGGALVGGVGLVRVFWVMRRMASEEQRSSMNKNHWLWHAILPLASFALMSSGVLWLALGGGTKAFMSIGLATGLLLISGIWRAWELVLWIARQRSGGAA